jgi:hypothetical protein
LPGPPPEPGAAGAHPARPGRLPERPRTAPVRPGRLPERPRTAPICRRFADDGRYATRLAARCVIMDSAGGGLPVIGAKMGSWPTGRQFQGHGGS